MRCCFLETVSSGAGCAMKSGDQRRVEVIWVRGQIEDVAQHIRACFQDGFAAWTYMADQETERAVI